MNVLLISVYPPHPAPEAHHAFFLSEQLAGAGVRVHVLCPQGSLAASHHNIEVHAVVRDWSWADLPKVVKCLRAVQPDAVLLLYLGWVYAHQPMITFLPTICRKLLGEVPCVTQFENIDEGCPPRPLDVRLLRHVMVWWAGRRESHRLLGTLLRDSKRLIVLSSPHRDRLARQGNNILDKTVIVPPSALIRVCGDDPASTRQRMRKALGVNDTTFVFLYSGYIYPGKGVETLLEAFSRVMRKHSDVHLVLVGSWLELPHLNSREYYETVQQLSEQLGLGARVTWTGPFELESDMGSQYLHAGDACVLPHDQGVTLNNSSLASATTHGLPIIGTETKDHPDEALEHGRHLYLCHPQDPSELAEAMQQLIENPSFRDRLRQGSRELARTWHQWGATTKRILEVLEGAISEKVGSIGRPSPAEKKRERVESASGDDRASPIELIPSQAEQEPLVSIIVAVYNSAPYLCQCLDSLVNQTLQPIEIIAVNDASTDHSLDLLKAYHARYPNLRIIDCPKNLGVFGARNIGVNAAKGTYVGFVDGDDWVDITMFENMYCTARAGDADLLIANATVFHNDSKRFEPFWDQGLRKEIDPRLKTMAFELCDEPRLLSLAPHSWIKIFKRAFLQEYQLHFQEGISLFSSFSHHFFVLLKARRICLIDKPLYFYRWSRPGQLSFRTDPKSFEVFEVLNRIQANFATRKLPDGIWALLVKAELKLFNWILEGRVPPNRIAEFVGRVSHQLRSIPKNGFAHFRRAADPDELVKLFCLRWNWVGGYRRVARRDWLVYPLLYLGFHNRRRGILGRGYRRGLRYLRAMKQTVFRSLLKWNRFSRQMERLIERLAPQAPVPSVSAESNAVTVYRIHEQELLLAHWGDLGGLEEAVTRMEQDYYLSQTAVFRVGDVIIDVGAHVGVEAIYWAKKFPFLTVYAVEPEPHNYSCLLRNIVLNGVSNVIAINKGLSGDGRPRTLYVDAKKSTWATIDQTMASRGRVLHRFQIETLTLEQLFRDAKIRYCRMLKISVLGAVREALAAFSEPGYIDFLCGEVALEDCSRPQLEVVSWRLARHHFWRTTQEGPEGTVTDWLHQLPRQPEQGPAGRPAMASFKEKKAL